MQSSRISWYIRQWSRCFWLSQVDIEYIDPKVWNWWLLLISNSNRLMFLFQTKVNQLGGRAVSNWPIITFGLWKVAHRRKLRYQCKTNETHSDRKNYVVASKLLYNIALIQSSIQFLSQVSNTLQMASLDRPVKRQRTSFITEKYRWILPRHRWVATVAFL